MKNLNKLKSLVKGSIFENEPMSKHTSYGIGGPALAYIIPKDKNDLTVILNHANNYKIPVYFIGSGSNLLVSDDGIKGIVVSPQKSLKKLEINNNFIIYFIYYIIISYCMIYHYIIYIYF